jgi:hypothetical protein
VDAAQILDVAPGPDCYLVLIGPQHRPVPDAAPWAQPDGTDNYRARRDPRAGIDRGNRVPQRPDQDRIPSFASVKSATW